MVLKARITSILDVVLRVPPVFVLDSVILSGFSELSKHVSFEDGEYEDVEPDIIDDVLPPSVHSPSNGSNSTYGSLFSSAATSSSDGTSSVAHNFMGSSMMVLGYTASVYLSFGVFLLPTKSLFNFYLWLMSIAIAFWSYVSNEHYSQYVSTLKTSSVPQALVEMNDLMVWYKVGSNYFLQVLLSFAFCYLSSHLYQRKSVFLSKRVVGVFFLIPTIMSLLPSDLPSSIPSTWLSLVFEGKDSTRDPSPYSRLRSLGLALSPLLSLSVAIFYIILNVIMHLKDIIIEIVGDIEWAREIVRHYGIYTLFENQWTRLHVPQVLRVFWLTRIAEHAIALFADFPDMSYSYFELGNIRLPADMSVYTTAAKVLIVRGCETIIAVLGMTSILSSISHQIGCVVQWFLAVDEPEDRNIGSVSAILFFILALQTGITGMEPEKRFQRLYRNICLLFTAILHFIHNMVNPLLNSLSASRNLCVSKHTRALLVCLFLIAFPTWFLFFLWKHETSLSTWLLAVSAFSIEVVIKVVISLLIYTLFMIDAFRTTLWEPLDDYVYYIKATGSTIEFIFGIFLFFNGAWILIFESGGTIRALMMCIHAYFNIWLQAKQG